MATVGLVGGLGPESTIDYYRRLISVWQREDPSSAPSVVIDSLDVQRGLRLVASDHAALADYLFESIQRLVGADVDFVALTANTPHIVFDDLQKRSPIPLLSIVEVCADAAASRGFRKLALLGTRFTMEAPFYPTVFARRQLDIVIPGDADRAWVHDRYVNQLIPGDFRDETRKEFVGLIAKLRETAGVDSVILGGTEIPLLLRDNEVAGVPTLDTTALHVEAIVRRLREA